jgi:hypothetical protein
MEVDFAPHADACVDWKVVLRTCRNHQQQDCQKSRGRLENSGYIAPRAPYLTDAVEMVRLGCAGTSRLQVLAAGDRKKDGWSGWGKACKNAFGASTQSLLRCREPVVRGNKYRTETSTN